MSPTPAGIASAIAINLRTRAIVTQVYGPFAGGDGAVVQRVKLNNGALIQVTVRELEERS